MDGLGQAPSKRRKTSDANTWTCQLCTLDNSNKYDRCTACSSPKPNKNRRNDDYKSIFDDNKQSVELKNNNDDSNNISNLINGLKSFRINANNANNANQQQQQKGENGGNDNDNNDALNSMDGIIGQLEKFQFDKNANCAMGNNSKMNDIINKLSHLNMSNSNKNEIVNMVKDINDEINKFIIELQQSLYWRFKIKNETKRFKKIEHRESIDRIVQILTFYHDNHNEEFSLFEYVNDDDGEYEHLKKDYENIIEKNIISRDNIITMTKQFDLCRDYILQNLPKCDIKTCGIYSRYHDEVDEDDDMFDDDIKEFKKKMDLLHCYFFHSDNCGIIINNKVEKYQHLKFGGQWYWFFHDAEVKWMPYNRENQRKLNEGWRNNQNEVIIGKYRIKFKRGSTNPCGEQQDYHRKNSWKRAVIYGIADRDGLLNGITCEKQQL